MIENCVYRHWDDLSDYWFDLGTLTWTYEHRAFSNEMIAEICTLPEMMDTMKYWGEELLRNYQRQETWLASFMLKHGATPAPILVFKGGEELIHTRGLLNENMCTPYQLIEGHTRTAYLWGMRRNSYSGIKPEHQV